MKKLILAAFVLFMFGTANAGIPLLNYSCPGKIEVHADAGGPVYINGKQVKVKKIDDNNFDAKGGWRDHFHQH